MKRGNDYIRTGFDKIDADLKVLIDCFGETLCALGGKDLALRLPWRDQRPSARSLRHAPETLEQAYSIAFQLLNMVEENTAARTRRTREIHGDDAQEPGLWISYLQRLRKAGFSDADIAEFLPSVRIEPVLTAHPTEAKRASVLEQHREIFHLLSTLDTPGLAPSAVEAIRSEIQLSLERLWRSGEILLEKPEVAGERRNVLFYLREVFPRTLAKLDERLRRAWKHAGFDPRHLDNPHGWPRVRFGTWVGGDRDGHPFVTPEVTADTLVELRQNGLLVLDRRLEELAAKLPLSSNFQQPPDELTRAIERLYQELGPASHHLVCDYRDEPWRQFVLLLRAKLPLPQEFRSHDVAIDQDCCYRIPADLDKDLILLHESLAAVGADRIAANAVWPVRRALDVFGFHLAALDIRQNSRYHDIALGQILEACGLDGRNFSNWPEEKRLELLYRELQSPRPFLYHDVGIGPEADALLACYRVVKNHIRKHGHDGIGAFIVSMTRSLSDLFVVYLLAREAGLMRWKEGGLVCEVPVVPLFETKEDLEESASLLRAFFQHPVAQNSIRYHLAVRQTTLKKPTTRPVQQVMIGYSDSNKDCGILASQWALHRAQLAITAAGEDHDVQIRFFHGRGGTISRGAGPTHRFLDALPAGSIQGDLRLTEQGETIAQKYANLETATYNLELLLAGVTGVSLGHAKLEPLDPDLERMCELLSESSSAAYSSLVNTDGFLEFYSHATPIDALEVTRIGSRPARRTGQRTLADLRAIPWVFSWNQSRFYLPGWYGVGAALDALKRTDPQLFDSLCRNIRRLPFLYYVLTNVETNLASADLGIMRRYATLVDDQTVRKRILQLVAGEFRRTQRTLGEVFGGDISERRPRMQRTLRLRADALRILHERQIATLREWRAAKTQSQANALLPKVILSINAIASGLRTTG